MKQNEDAFAKLWSAAIRRSAGLKGRPLDTYHRRAVAPTSSQPTLRKHIGIYCVAIAILAAALFAPPAAAQRCTGNVNTGCSHPGAVCSPVTTGVGPTGHCKTRSDLPPGELECDCAGAPELNLTGTWIANDGAIYYLRHIGNELWWAGFSVETPAGIGDLHKGLLFTNVFHGQLSGNTVAGEWADVPRGRLLNSGTLALSVSADQIQRQAVTGGFGAAVWNRIALPPPPADIFSIFDRVKKNQNAWRDHSLLDNLKPAKARPVVIFGNIIREDPNDPANLDPMHVNYHTYYGRSYNDFICLNNNDSPPDGDIDFGIKVDRAALDAQIGFWTDGWETDHGVTPSNFRNKLDRQNEVHVESIMYGGTTECGDDAMNSLLLPGWQQGGAAGVLYNGIPIAGQMELIDHTRISSQVYSILGRQILFNARVRVTGILALDCGHGWRHNCDEDDGETQNQEIHPVYALDFVQNFQLPRPLALLSGVWSSDDAGTYYVRQIGSTVWWLGLSVDEGQTFANVFRGTLQNNRVSGSWADIPLGHTANGGTLTLLGGAGALSTAWNRVAVSGGFGGASWEKLYDIDARRVVVVFESAVSSGSQWPGTAEPFEFTVGGQTVQAQPTRPRTMQITDGIQAMQADLGARVPINLSVAGPLRLAARYAGYRASWTISEPNLKPGVYVQPMATPQMLSVDVHERDKSEVGDRDIRKSDVTDANATSQVLPDISVRYRIELTDAPH